MTERPILFSGPMVRAIFEGRKSQTRRLVKPVGRDEGFVLVEHDGGAWWPHRSDDGESMFVTLKGSSHDIPIGCPYGTPGDRLWVRETLRTHGCFGFPLGKCPQVKPIQGRIWSYAADNIPDWTGGRPSIHMPRWACRLVLEVTAVRVERLQTISADDAIAEGIVKRARSAAFPWHVYAAEDYAILWDDINVKRAPWASNPLVWVIEFKRISDIGQP